MKIMRDLISHKYFFKMVIKMNLLLKWLIRLALYWDIESQNNHRNDKLSKRQSIYKRNGV